MAQRELSGILFRNDRKTSDKHPDYRGEATLEGKPWRLAGWIKEGRDGKFLSIAFSEPQQRQAPPQEAPAESHEEPEGIPF